MRKIAALLILVVLASCGRLWNRAEEFHAAPIPKDWKIYDHANYDIEYPPDWELREDIAGTEFAIMAPEEEESPTFMENVNLTIENISGESHDIEKLTLAAIKLMKIMTPDFILISNKRMKDRYGDFQQMICTSTQNSIPLEQEQWYRIVNDKLCILTLTTLRDKWATGHEIGEQIMSSFVITP